MNKIIRILAINLVFVSLTACSLPGVPGLNVKSSRFEKAQKEGVDYKLVVLNADAIRKQKPFDVEVYIRDKKQRASLSKSRLKSIEFNETAEQKISKVSSKFDDSNLLKLAESQALSEEQAQTKSQAFNVSSAINSSGFEGVTASDNKANYQYYLGKGDVLSITVWDHPELTTPSENNAFGGHVIGSDGRFYFPYSGKIKAEGKTIREIRDVLESKLGSFITKPQVSVSIANYRSQKIYTSGALVQPAAFVIQDRPITVRDAISQSGGLSPKQYTGYATLARNGRNISIDLNRMLKHNDNRQNFILKNGDRLNVVERTELDDFNKKLKLEVRQLNTLSSERLNNEIESLNTLSPIRLKFELERERAVSTLEKELEKELKSGQAKVFVMGEVLRPGSVSYQVEDGMTLAEAINDAGSFREDSVNPKGIFVIRKENSNDNIPTVYQLPIASVHSILLAEEFGIRPRDIVFVTAAPTVRFNRVISQLLPSLAVLNTFRNFR